MIINSSTIYTNDKNQQDQYQTILNKHVQSYNKVQTNKILNYVRIMFSLFFEAKILIIYENNSIRPLYMSIGNTIIYKFYQINYVYKLLRFNFLQSCII